MANSNELINILKAELTLLSQEILQNIHQKDITDLYKSVRKLYEKMAAIYVLEKKLKDTDDLLKLILPKPVEDVQSSTVPDVSLPEQNKQEKINVEQSAGEANHRESNPYEQEISFVPKQKETTKTEPVSPINSPEKPFGSSKNISIGLNDRIAFIKNLFNGDAQMYERVIDTLNAFDKYESALRYIYNDIKPHYNNWEGKDEYEFRLIQLLELKFN